MLVLVRHSMLLTLHARLHNHFVFGCFSWFCGWNIFSLQNIWEYLWNCYSVKSLSYNYHFCHSIPIALLRYSKRSLVIVVDYFVIDYWPALFPLIVCRIYYTVLFRQSPIQESLIDFSDSGTNRVAADIFLGEKRRREASAVCVC